MARRTAEVVTERDACAALAEATSDRAYTHLGSFAAGAMWALAWVHDDTQLSPSELHARILRQRGERQRARR